jgi:hypothetical protein
MVLSFVYTVDDHGVEFRYRGEGGRDSKTKKLVVSIFIIIILDFVCGQLVAKLNICDGKTLLPYILIQSLTFT